VSLAIDEDRVQSVLLADGEWHSVHWEDGRSSFYADAFEILDYGGSDERRRAGEPIFTVQPKAETAGIGFLWCNGSDSHKNCLVFGWVKVPLNYVYGLSMPEDR